MISFSPITSNSNWQPVLNPSQIQTVQEVFGKFVPEKFAPGTDPSNRLNLVPSNFQPALFFGVQRPRGMRPSPNGVLVETNGFDEADFPLLLPPAGTYFEVSGNPFQFSLGLVTLFPQNKLESRMGYSLSSGTTPLVFDLRQSRVDLAEVERIIVETQIALSNVLPHVAQVNIRNCEVVIEPTIFYVRGSNFGDVWAGGSTQDLGSGKYRLHVQRFYINSQKLVLDWRHFLVDEAMNFFMLSIGRRDLAI